MTRNSGVLSAAAVHNTGVPPGLPALAVGLAVIFPGALVAQMGGSGVDGQFRPTASVILDTSGRQAGWSFSSVDIPAGVEVRLQGSNPAILRCTGDVRIDGRLSADGFRASGAFPGAGGPGGFAGGAPGAVGEGPAGGQAGFGNSTIRFPPGNGGHATLGSGSTGSPYGTDWVFDLRGGSGGGGFRGTGSLSGVVLGGHGGGGVVLVLADGSVDVSAGGAVTADGAGDGAEASGAGGGVLIRSATNVRIASNARVTAIGARHPVLPLGAGDGFVRFDAYGEKATVGLQANVSPSPRSLFLPALQATIAIVGGRWFFGVACVPGDNIVFLWSPGTASIPLAQLGILELDSAAGIFALATARATLLEVDPYPIAWVDVPNSPALRGVGANLQALTIQTASIEGPHLSQGVTGTFQ